MEQEIGTWDSVLLENLSEDNFVNNIHLRYERDFIYTYIGTSVLAVNPYHQISEDSLENIRSYGTKGIFQLPPHIYGVANLAFESLKDQSEDQCILLSGESGAGKTESFKMIVNFLTHIQESPKTLHLKRQTPPPPLNSSITSCSYTRSHQHRTTPSCCSAGTSFLFHKSSPVPSCIAGGSAKRHQSSSPGPVAARRCGGESAVVTQRTRSECIVDRQSKQTIREKIVDFDFLHKSSENIALLGGNVPSNTHKSRCSKHQASKNPTHLNPCTTATSTSQQSLSRDHGASPKYLNMSLSGCRMCGHSKCRARASLENDEKELLALSAHLSTTYTTAAYKHRGSCSNLMRQPSNENQSEHMSSSGHMDTPTQRMSLYDAYSARLSQGCIPTAAASVNKTSSPQTTFLPIHPRTQHKNKAQKLRECVTCADVFLEAMGNASTLKNNNSSRYGKLFDIEINFKGDPIGVHITHYENNKYNDWRTKFSYILSAIIWC